MSERSKEFSLGGRTTSCTTSAGTTRTQPGRRRATGSSERCASTITSTSGSGSWGQRLEHGPHPFTEDDARAHRATLLRFMSAAPRLTAPIVEPARRSEYRVRRAQPMKKYEGRTM